MSRLFGPKEADHFSVGQPCPRCSLPLQIGDMTSLIEVEPAGEEDATKKAKGRAYNAVAAEVHGDCLTLREAFGERQYYRRRLTFDGKPYNLATRLGVTPERAEEIDTFVNSFIDRNASLEETVQALNERGDLNDSEWTTAMYALGYLLGGRR